MCIRDRTIPVEKDPNATYVQVCESAPITTSPATTNPFSGNRQCSIPISPISKKLTIPFSLENSLINLHCSAAVSYTHLDVYKRQHEGLMREHVLGYHNR